MVSGKMYMKPMNPKGVMDAELKLTHMLARWAEDQPGYNPRQFYFQLGMLASYRNVLGGNLEDVLTEDLRNRYERYLSKDFLHSLIEGEKKQ